ncbi:MAG: hypothetical protein AB7U65_10630, partial [Halothiobacillaceae bacterium]
RWPIAVPGAEQSEAPLSPFFRLTSKVTTDIGKEQGLTSLRSVALAPAALRLQGQTKKPAGRNIMGDPVTKKRRHGPAPKPAHALRRHAITCRLTDAELVRLDEGRPAGMTRGEWLRTRALKRRLLRAIPEVNREAWADLARVSGNLNQYMRAINEGRANQPAVDVDLAELRRLVGALRRELIGFDDSEAADDEE